MTISVIIPFYNAAATLERCLSSLAQAGGPVAEIICVDDGSTDDSCDIAARFDVRLVQMRRRSGAAAARNLAASMATGDVLLIAPPGLLDRIAEAFAREPELDALFGAYTIFPAERNFASVYKNLVHHFTHATSRSEAWTFWCGCGALRREAFARVGGFDEGYAAASVEDLELGYRLRKAGGRIRLDPSLRVIHAKRYTLGSLVRSDLFNRAIPWTRLMARENVFRADLNLKAANIASGVLLTLLLPLALFALFVLPASVTWPLAPALVLAFIALNARIGWFVARVKGLPFALLFLLMYAFAYLYSALGFVLGLATYLVQRGIASDRRTD
jgi:GT2 family glycosyltransferase